MIPQKGDHIVGVHPFATDCIRSAMTFVDEQAKNIIQSASSEITVLKVLAAEIWGHHMLVVFDVNHHNYD